MNSYDKIISLREAGNVQRLHTVPTLKPYLVSSHSWNAAMLVAEFWPGEERLLMAALYHDVPERWTGDLPSHVFGADERLREIFSAMDRAVTEKFELISEHDLNPDEWDRLRQVDALELLLFCFEEMRMGNLMVARVIEKVLENFRVREEDGRIDPQVKSFIRKLEKHRHKRKEEGFDWQTT